MDVALLDDVDRGTEKLAAGAQTDLVSMAEARRAWATIARIENRLAALKAALAPRLNDVEAMARVSGTSVTKAKQTVEAGKALRNNDVVRDALAGGSISMDQASEIVKAETAAPGSARDLLEVAASSSFQVLRERSRKVVLEAERHRGLADRQREARTARHFTDDLGMRNIHLKLPPVLGEAICNRAENEARRLHTAAKREDREEPFERHLADAFAKMLSGSEVKGHHERADVTILVSHEVVKRGWSDVRDGDRCEIPGVGPVAPEVAKEIAQDAFLSGVFYDGKDLRTSRPSAAKHGARCVALSSWARRRSSMGSSAADAANASATRATTSIRALQGVRPVPRTTIGSAIGVTWSRPRKIGMPAN